MPRLVHMGNDILPPIAKVDVDFDIKSYNPVASKSLFDFFINKDLAPFDNIYQIEMGVTDGSKKYTFKRNFRNTPTVFLYNGSEAINITKNGFECPASTNVKWLAYYIAR